jgi:hypothetical protein
MYEPIKIHISLDEAREELKKRWNNLELRKAVEEELGENFIPLFKDRPRAFLSRFLTSPDNGFMLFCQSAHYLNASPISMELQGDIFVHFNEEKKGLGRLRVTLEDGAKVTVDIMDFHANEKNIISEVKIKTGEKLSDFHHNLLKISKYNPEIWDKTAWVGRIGKPVDWYYPFFLHTIAHGVIFENVEAYDNDESGIIFTRDITTPAIQKIESKFGLRPLVVRTYPQDQAEEEDFYWWSYPKNINNYIINYAIKYNLPFKNIKI